MRRVCPTQSRRGAETAKKLREFSDVLEIRNGKDQKKVETADGIYPIYGSGGKMGRASAYICPGETVVIGRKGSINNPIFVHEPFWNVDTAFGLIAKEGVLNPSYLFHFCRSFDFSSLSTTVTIPSLTKANLLKVQLPLASLAEQKRIAAVLDKICELKKNAETRLEKLDALVKSRFVEMFGDLSGSSFPRSTIGEVCEVKSGGTPDRKVREYWENGDIPWVKTTELKNCELYDSEEHITSLAMSESSAKLVPPETILLAMYGQGRTRGMTAKLKIAATTNQACACILPSRKIDQDYLWHYLVLSYEKIRALAQGAGQPNLNGKMIRSFGVPLPPLALQREFAAFVEKIDKLRETARQTVKAMDTLYRAKLQEFFG